MLHVILTEKNKLSMWGKMKTLYLYSSFAGATHISCSWIGFSISIWLRSSRLGFRVAPCISHSEIGVLRNSCHWGLLFPKLIAGRQEGQMEICDTFQTLCLTLYHFISAILVCSKQVMWATLKSMGNRDVYFCSSGRSQ